jgi:gas vesicle protein
MTQKKSPLTTGIVAGLAVGLLIPKVAKKIKQWSEKPEVRESLKEILPTKEELKSESSRARDLWKNREKSIAQATQTVKTRWNALVSNFEDSAEEKSAQVAEDVVEQTEKNSDKAQKAVKKTARVASQKIQETKKSAKKAVKSATSVNKRTAKKVAKKLKA